MSESQQGPNWWRATDGRWYPPQAPPQARRASRSVDVYAVGAGSLGMVVGSLLPWAKASAPLYGTVSFSGIDGDGVISVVAGVLGLLTGGVLLTGANRLWGWAAFLFGGLGSALAAYHLPRVHQLITETATEVEPVMASVGEGLYVLGIGSLITAIGGLGTASGIGRRTAP